MDWIGWVSRLAHILAAVTLGGGIFYLCGVQLPALRESGTPDEQLRESLRRRWARLVMLTTAVLLLSGFYNYFVVISAARAGTIELARFYHPLIGVKIILAMLVFFLAAILSGRSPAAERFQANMRLWMNVMVVAVLVIIGLASVLKVAGRVPATDNTPTPVQTAARDG